MCFALSSPCCDDSVPVVCLRACRCLRPGIVANPPTLNPLLITPSELLGGVNLTPRLREDHAMPTAPIRISDRSLAHLIRRRPDLGVPILHTQRVPIVLALLQRTGYPFKSTERDEIEHDLISETWRCIDRFDPGKGKLVTWMYSIARVQIIERRDAERSILPSSDRWGWNEPEVICCSPQSASGQMRDETLRRVIEHEMSERERVVTEHDAAAPNGRADTKQLQIELGCSANAIYQARKRAHAKLLRVLNRFTWKKGA